ncbi:Hypothetical predicted protein [Octopus vulgaris]|uniref:Uncharacterized protein n=1 Tax=Octopus vulgaris TaxID=6645 RepID=A0AA36BB31_OCTVU|nr:Hypothetical predicted protein [Octopus vulgaris]
MSDEGSPSKETVVGSPTSKIAKHTSEIDATKLKVAEGSHSDKAVITAKVAEGSPSDKDVITDKVVEGSPSDEAVKAAKVIEGSPSKGKQNDKTITYNFAAAAGRKTEEIKMEEIDYESYKTMFTREGNKCWGQ